MYADELFSNIYPYDAYIFYLDLGSYSSLGKNELTGNIAFLCDIEIFEYDAGEFQSYCTDFFNQKNIIADFYNALGQSCNQAVPECEWVGTMCNSNDAIVGIKLGELILSH